VRLENEKIGDIDSIGVRMPSALKAKIKASAKANKHSMNAEIVTRLESSFSVEITEKLGKDGLVLVDIILDLKGILDDERKLLSAYKEAFEALKKV